jgi:hypothetical protein
MPAGWFCGWGELAALPEEPAPMHGKRRGVTKSPKRAKRRNRRKP